MKTVYFSSSIFGVKKVPPEMPVNLVNHMKAMGYDVLSEHVALTDDNQVFATLSKKSGMQIPQRKGYEKEIRKADTAWVDKADYFVGLVDGPSLGVGMEIERALLRHERGLAPVDILCLVHADNYEGLSAMVKGVEAPQFFLKIYTDEADAIKIVSQFLQGEL